MGQNNSIIHQCSLHTCCQGPGYEGLHQPLRQDDVTTLVAASHVGERHRCRRDISGPTLAEHGKEGCAGAGAAGGVQCGLRMGGGEERREEFLGGDRGVDARPPPPYIHSP